ncbi:hypothetical protein H072_3730 [Dactylellina haptotyla CBS 200.50]|uniref:GDP-Man:Man(3)GlcNAc(2)-PP-Dol alpha-1,2-mannosyltransferase n=1 Tax=Dactylellina haptotyla (strain CBS 200.50) TaxID=1284197 RepID=S8AGZ7_DACHA|nr:hypothetical protein H072_3730 [Dactylellina haptotyla CBS 200.50]
MAGGHAAPVPDEEVCTYCAWVPYAIAAVPVVLPLLLFLLQRPILFLIGLYIRSQNGDKRELLLRVSHEEACRINPAQKDITKPSLIAGFFHPYCNAGGGGERVLWAAIHANQKRHPELLNVVYTGDHVTKTTMLNNVLHRFDISLNPSLVQFIHLQKRHLVSSSSWPRFTLLGQSLGSVFLALEAFGMLVPDIYIDTMGYAFTVILAKKLFRIPTGAYVHYPTISTDMLGALSPTNRLKKRYWEVFALLYSWAGTEIDVVVANSSWTAGHLNSLWRGISSKGTPEFTGFLNGLVKWISGRRRGENVQVLFPPCAVKKLAESIQLKEQRDNAILYIAQFRPEKNHPLVLQAFQQFLRSAPEGLKGTKLVFIGSVREDQDEKKVYELRLLAKELQIENNVLFITNAPWGDVIKWLGQASVGVNAMWNEHFGIGVVEYQAAGLIGVVHDSGGPKLDIVVEIDGERTGYHAETADQYAEGFKQALSLDPKETVAMRERARKSSMRFSEEIFADQWDGVMDSLLAIKEGKKKR